MMTAMATDTEGDSHGNSISNGDSKSNGCSTLVTVEVMNDDTSNGGKNGDSNIRWPQQ